MTVGPFLVSVGSFCCGHAMVLWPWAWTHQDQFLVILTRLPYRITTDDTWSWNYIFSMTWWLLTDCYILWNSTRNQSRRQHHQDNKVISSPYQMKLDQNYDVASGWWIECDVETVNRGKRQHQVDNDTVMLKEVYSTMKSQQLLSFLICVSSQQNRERKCIFTSAQQGRK